MADPGLLGGVDYAGMLSGAASGMYTLMIVLGYSLAAGLLLLLIMYYSKHDYDVVLRLQTAQGNLILKRRGRIVDTGKHKIMKFFLDFKHRVYSVPPKQCIDFTKRGRKVAEVVIDEEGNARWLEVHDIGEKVCFNALDTNERAAYVDEIEKAEKRRTRNVLDLIRDIAPLLALTTIFVVAIIFWGDIVAPFISMGDQLVDVADSISGLVDKLDRVVNVLANNQVIEHLGNQSGLLNSSIVPPEATG